jgi:hypothetical protein
MSATKLFDVTETFALAGGLIVVTDTPVERLETEVRIGDLFEFVRPDGSRFRTPLRGFEMFVPPDPDRGFAFMIGKEFGKTDVPQGTRIFKVGATS